MRFLCLFGVCFAREYFVGTGVLDGPQKRNRFGVGRFLKKLTYSSVFSSSVSAFTSTVLGFLKIKNKKSAHIGIDKIRPIKK